ncbi:sulfatase-like hydrolase/transferase [Aquimarina algiphila]|uniref:sulfatase-like hydrolase/transferase n=1 Tax=Aquimarina algiphila TaxID=2047982 RepID=UPI00232DFF5A|nr:sulfatase-like hydrolase/transferase [Aquimarina algiphila]
MNISRKKLPVYSFILLVATCIGCNSAKQDGDNNKTAERIETKILNTPKRPNIVMILCDDLGYSDVGFNGSKDIKTPTLDVLASTGVKFTSAYVPHPFCGPSRAGILTGRYAHTIGAQFNLPPNSETIGKGIDVHEKLMSKMLNESGYRTGLVGKWHLGAVDKYHPNSRGFDEFYGFLGGGHNYHPEDYKTKYAKAKERGTKVIWDYLTPLEHNGTEVTNDNEYLTDVLSKQGVRFIEASSKQDNPFFLFMSYNAPHTPLEAKKEDLEVFSSIKSKDRRTYAAMVYAVDRGVNKIVESLKATGEYDNTLIIFYSDNGGRPDKGATNFPLKEGKGSVYEGGYRVPMFFHWNGIVPSGLIYDNPVSALDLYPTFAKLADAKIPLNKKLDGKDMWNSFMMNKEVRADDNIFTMRHRNGFSDVGIRNGKWKAVKAYNQKWKLFDIEKDIEESNDISAVHPQILKKLVAEAKDWSKTHIQPRWWHNKKTGHEWKEKGMPHFDETFSLN